ncbi:hypothetical protein DGG96_00970 [Legionella qingyii]|uniref:Uncharacterized protein n=1 Tax=Legionella qingyii TaxID=2184757 RepID=A0A317UAL8_9GAMM|nr:hypothetical protein [Legionella qingyii]PWY57697.1 hypothetical protein DGG96_00970 [Legionella qingyii]RUR25837.1 hypothetical protein ELY20_01425 [Legionella qingyii]
MSGQSIQYWCTVWKRLEKENDEFEIAKKLLFKYSGAYSSIFCRPYVWGGSIGRFFSFRWATNHGDEVQNALASVHNQSFDKYYGSYGSILQADVEPSPKAKVMDLLQKLKKNLGKKRLAEDGDLYRILFVIQEKLELDYAEIEVNYDSDEQPINYIKQDIQVQREALEAQKATEASRTSFSKTLRLPKHLASMEF